MKNAIPERMAFFLREIPVSLSAFIQISGILIKYLNCIILVNYFDLCFYFLKLHVITSVFAKYGLLDVYNSDNYCIVFYVMYWL